MTDQDKKLHTFVMNTLVHDYDLNKPFVEAMTPKCEKAVKDGLICEYKLTPIENLTKNGKKVFGTVALRLRPEVEFRTFFIKEPITKHYGD